VLRKYFIELKLFCLLKGCTEFPEFFMFVEIPEYGTPSFPGLWSPCMKLSKDGLKTDASGEHKHTC